MKQSVLVIDDDRTVHTILAKMLEAFDGEILHAYDGAEGLGMAREHKPKLVLTDALLPRIDGRELSRAIKEDPAMCGTKVVVMTALYKGSRYRQEAFADFRVDDWVEKPLTPGRMKMIMEKMLGSAAGVAA